MIKFLKTPRYRLFFTLILLPWLVPLIASIKHNFGLLDFVLTVLVFGFGWGAFAYFLFTLIFTPKTNSSNSSNNRNVDFGTSNGNVFLNPQTGRIEYHQQAGFVRLDNDSF